MVAHQLPKLRVAGSNPVARSSLSSFCPFKFAAQLDRFTVWFDEGELYDVLVRVNYRERHALHKSSLRASGDIEEIEVARLSIR